MTVDELCELFEKHHEEYGKFDCIQKKFTKRPDLHAFLLLETLLPDNVSDIVSAAEHDEIYLGVELSDLAEVVKEENIIDLIRCGVFISDESLKMFA